MEIKREVLRATDDAGNVVYHRQTTPRARPPKFQLEDVGWAGRVGATPKRIGFKCSQNPATAEFFLLAPNANIVDSDGARSAQ